MDNHGYPFGFWISMNKWLSISDVPQYLFLNQILSARSISPESSLISALIPEYYFLKLETFPEIMEVF
jgi:hypothetical protein